MIIYDHVRDLATEGDRVLDIGTKSGEHLDGIRGQCVGIDLELEPATDSIEFVVGDGTELPFEPRTFDYAISNMVFEHIPGEQKRPLIREIARVLKSDGEFFISFPNRLFPNEGHGLPVHTKLPRQLVVPLSSRTVERDEYYRKHIHNITPLSGRRILRGSFLDVEYTTIQSASQYADRNSTWRRFARAFQAMQRAEDVLPVRWLYELGFPYVAYRCRNPMN